MSNQTSKSKTIEDPSTAFLSPGDLMNDPSMTSDQKIKALESWLFTVRARVDAVSEGMNSHQEGLYTKDVELAHKLEKALLELK